VGDYKSVGKFASAQPYLTELALYLKVLMPFSKYF